MSGRGRQPPRRQQPPRSAPLSGRAQQMHQRPQAGPSATTGSFIKPAPAHEVFTASFPGETAKYGQVHLQKTPKRVYKAQKGGYILKEKIDLVLYLDLQMLLTPKDLSFVGYTYKNFEAVKGLKRSTSLNRSSIDSANSDSVLDYSKKYSVDDMEAQVLADSGDIMSE